MSFAVFVSSPPAQEEDHTHHCIYLLSLVDDVYKYTTAAPQDHRMHVSARHLLFVSRSVLSKSLPPSLPASRRRYDTLSSPGRYLLAVQYHNRRSLVCFHARDLRSLPLFVVEDGPVLQGHVGEE